MDKFVSPLEDHAIIKTLLSLENYSKIFCTNFQITDVIAVFIKEMFLKLSSAG